MLRIELDKSISVRMDPVELDEEVLQSIRSKFGFKNFFGLPPYAMQQTPQALTYQCRKPVRAVERSINKLLRFPYSKF
jgi:hypothetical protein